MHEPSTEPSVPWSSSTMSMLSPLQPKVEAGTPGRSKIADVVAPFASVNVRSPTHEWLIPTVGHT